MNNIVNLNKRHRRSLKLSEPVLESQL
jgi:hypothetical protein